MQSTKQSCIKKLRSPYFVLCTTFFGIFAYCEQCLWKIYHVYNLIVCRMTAAVPPPAPSLVQHRHRTFLLSLQRRLLEVSYFGVSSSFFCCKTNRKSNWQLCWEMKGTNLFFFQKKSTRVATCIQMRTYTQQLLFRRTAARKDISAFFTFIFVE